MAEFKYVCMFVCNASLSHHIIFKALYLLWFKFKYLNGYTRVVQGDVNSVQNFHLGSKFFRQAAFSISIKRSTNFETA